MEKPPNKSNLSFSFSLENMDDVDSAASSDSETTGLQIDVSEVDNLNHSNKIRRQEIDDTSFINEMEEEIERQLDAKASKTKLTATNVKNILKSVISDENVMEMVRSKLTKTSGDAIFEPKLTRAKAKELDISWAITPVKNPTSKAHILIEKEFSEDSSDEEYQPEQDIQSDEERDVDGTGNDIDSFPSTPATPDRSKFSEIVETSEVQYNDGGIFKVPNVPFVPTEGESIVHRTRSKLCLSETPLEQIEQQFIPPDITSDMYDWDWEPADDYHQFLKDLYAEPPPKEIDIQDDPDADPEYNILEDEELLDKEELRDDRAVKIPKRELQTLISELAEFADQYTLQQEQNEQEQQQMKEPSFQPLSQQQEHPKQQLQQKLPKKKRSVESLLVTSSNVSINNPMVDLLPVLAEPELPQIVNTHQRRLLSVQISQHVQLMTQQFLMTFKHPTLHQHSKICKDNLHSLITLSHQSNPYESNSEFLVQNLFDAIQLISNWELKLKDPKFLKDYIGFLKSEIEEETEAKKHKKRHQTQFHPELIKYMSNSKALMHPQLLPDIFPTSIKTTLPYFKSEENLIALGMEQFVAHLNHSNKLFNRNCDVLADVVDQIHRYLMPVRDTRSLIFHIKRRKSHKNMNPIKYYCIYGAAPKVEHYVLNKYKLLAPIEQPLQCLSKTWQKFISALENLDQTSIIYSLKSKKQDENQSSFLTSFEEVLQQKEIKIILPHEFRNPIINMMHMPTLLTPQKDDQSINQNTSSASSTLSTSFKDNKPISNNLPMINTPTSTPQKEGSNISIRNSSVKARLSQQSKSNEIESDAESAESFRACETDEEESRPTRLRMTTPRLAKIKSAQNMKLLAQTLSSKGSTSISSVTESKDENPDKVDDDVASSVKGDNEDEIAELMLASTTIKKNLTRKKTKQARELEKMRRLVEAENNINEEERATKFAASFIQKIHNKLESKDPELYKIVFKLLSEYSETLESYSANEENKEIREIRDKLSVKLYEEVCEKLKKYPDLCSDFLLFLTPHQAAMVDKAVDLTMMLKMKDFVNVTQMYFAKQPSRIAKVMQAITQMTADHSTSLENAQNIMGAALKGHPLIMDLFLQVLPTGKPPDSLFATHMFENLTCPVGPHDKNKTYDADAHELYENIELPVSTPQEDPYGGDSCKCDCHGSGEDSKLKGTNEHCASCGTRFLNGRIYLQTSEGLRPAKITFPGADDEKLENISRVSLKTTERIIPCPPSRKRRKSSKGDSISDEPALKIPCFKNSPTKDTEEGDKLSTKSKKGIKSPPKFTDTKKLVKVTSTTLKNKREKKSEKKIKSDSKTEDEQNEYCTNTDQIDGEEGLGSSTNEDITEELFGSKLGEISTDSHEDNSVADLDKTLATGRKFDICSDSDISTTTEVEKTEKLSSNELWTMQDDKILLEHVKKDYSENTFVVVSQILKNRTVEQVKERCQYLLSLIEKMANNPSCTHYFYTKCK